MLNVTIPKIKAEITLAHEGVDYKFIDSRASYLKVIRQGDFDFSYTTYYSSEDWLQEEQDGFAFWWEEGNGGCDCNRSKAIKRYCDENFSLMTCGHEIKLVSLEFIP